MLVQQDRQLCKDPWQQGRPIQDGQ